MLPEHTTNSVASASSKLRAGEHWARLHDIQHIQESVGLLGRIPLVVLEYRLAGGWLSITLPEGGSALIAHFGQLLASRSDNQRAGSSRKIFAEHPLLVEGRLALWPAQGLQRPCPLNRLSFLLLNLLNR